MITDPVIIGANDKTKIKKVVQSKIELIPDPGHETIMDFALMRLLQNSRSTLSEMVSDTRNIIDQIVCHQVN